MRYFSPWSIFLFFLGIHAVFDLSRQRSPAGPLGIALDYNWARNSNSGQARPRSNKDIRPTVYSSHLTFHGDVSAITNGQIIKMTKDAWREMDVDREGYGFDSIPSVMHALVVGREVFFASSLRGAPNFIFNLVDSPVKDQLLRCEMVWGSMGYAGKSHKNKGSCGEMMSAHHYYRSHPDRTSMQTFGARSFSVRMYEDNVVAYIAPCGTDEAEDVIGCKAFLLYQGWQLVPNGEEEDYDLSSLAGGLIGRPEQIPTC